MQYIDQKSQLLQQHKMTLLTNILLSGCFNWIERLNIYFK